MHPDTHFNVVGVSDALHPLLLLVFCNEWAVILVMDGNDPLASTMNSQRVSEYAEELQSFYNFKKAVIWFNPLYFDKNKPHFTYAALYNFCYAYKPIKTKIYYASQKIFTCKLLGDNPCKANTSFLIK